MDPRIWIRLFLNESEDPETNYMDPETNYMDPETNYMDPERCPAPNNFNLRGKM